MAVEREERGSIELSDPFESFLRENGNECRSPPRKRRKRVATDKPVNIPEPFKADYIPENFPEPFDSEDHSAHGDHTGCTRTSSVGPTPPTTAPETLTQCHTLDDLSIPSILIDDDIDITSIQTDSETFVLSPDLSADLDASPNLKLYIGANISTLQAISMLVSWFSTFPGLSKSSFTHLLGILHNFILPKENNLPTTYDEAVAKLKPFLTPVKDYHCCINDCIIFRDCSAGNYGKLERCPHCSEERYLSGSKIPRKRFKYLSLEKRFRRFFANPKTAELLQNHSTELFQHKDNVVSTIHQCNAWKSMYGENGIFHGDQRALSLAICMDGLNPFARDKTSYSTCPMTVIILNLPHHVQMLAGSMLLTGLIAGPKEPKNINPYVDVLVDDLIDIGKLTLYDAYKDERFKLKTSVLLHIFDYPGQNKVMHCQGAGAYAGCSYCCIKGEYSTILNKMIYLDHRSFLPAIDKLRLNKKSFASPNDVPKSPTIKTMNYVDSVIGKLTAASSNNERKQIVRQSGCTGVYSLRKLPNHDRYLNTPVEPMHLIKNIAERVVKLLSGETDTVKVRMEEKQRNRFRSSWTTVVTENGKEKIYVPPAPFSLQKNEIDIANARAMNIRAPNGVDWQACHLFGKGASKLKSNEWKHVLSSGILKFCIRGLLGENQRNTLNELCDVISLICAEEIDLSIIDSLEYRVHRILSLLERDFPVSIHVIMFHLLHHLPTYIRRFGPVYNFWMYPMERFNSWISRRVLNRRYPESTVMETYRLYELSFFLQISDQLPSGAVTDIDKFNEDDENDHQYNDSLTESESEMDKKEHAPTSKLDPVDMNKLITCYRQIYPDYDKLVSKYERDKVIHEQTSTGYFPPISQWTPTSGPAMTPTELQFCKDTTDVVTRRKVYKMRDKHYRWIKYSSMEGERINSVRVSSYVHHKVGLVNGIKSFGRIQFMFDHMFNGHLHTLACVCWYDGHTTERDSGLVQVSKTSSTLTIVPFSDLSRPLIHAIDENDKNKLWILNSPS